MDDITGIYARQMPAFDATVQLGVASGRLIQVSFPEHPDENADADHPILDRIAAYADGEAEDFRDVEIALTVPSDQRAVLQTLRTVPHGESTDLASLQRRTPGLDPEDDDAAETVRAALAANPLPLVLPDHRVNAVDGATPSAIRRRLREIEEIDG